MKIRRAIAAAASALTLAGTGLAYTLLDAPAASADPANCETVLWGFLGSQRRSICDGPVKADGSWWRQRQIWIPAHNVPLTFYTSGSYSYSYTNCSGGYFQPFQEVAYDAYPVRPDNVLPDEPGHLGGAEVLG